MRAEVEGGSPEDCEMRAAAVGEIGVTPPAAGGKDAADEAGPGPAGCEIAAAGESEATAGEEEAATELDGARAGAEEGEFQSANKAPKMTKRSVGRRKRNDLFTGKNG